jgi:arylsulfatase A-like enzyme
VRRPAGAIGRTTGWNGWIDVQDSARVRRRWPRTAAAAGSALLALGAAAACAPRPPVTVAPRVGPAVVLISIDGLRPDAPHRAGARTLLRLSGAGAYDATAQTVLPSRTLPAHTSMVTGLTPLQHGITWNEDRTGELGLVQVPTIFDHVAAAGLTSTALFAKSKFRHLIRPGSPTYASAPRGALVRSAGEIVDDLEHRLRFGRPDLIFVHLGDADVFGHSFGWLSWPYRSAVRRADAAVARIIRAADRAYGPGRYTLIVTSDHGGIARGHGGGRPLERTIPWLALGPGVCPGVIGEPVFIEDTAPTVLALLGLTPPPEMSGRVVAEALGGVSAPRAVAAPPAPCDATSGSADRARRYEETAAAPHWRDTRLRRRRDADSEPPRDPLPAE